MREVKNCPKRNYNENSHHAQPLQSTRLLVSCVMRLIGYTSITSGVFHKHHSMARLQTTQVGHAITQEEPMVFAPIPHNTHHNLGDFIQVLYISQVHRGLEHLQSRMRVPVLQEDIMRCSALLCYLWSICLVRRHTVGEGMPSALQEAQPKDKKVTLLIGSRQKSRRPNCISASPSSYVSPTSRK